MKNFLLFAILCMSFYCNAKEWKSIKEYQKATNSIKLEATDWLKSDRKKNTIVWQKANSFNLKNLLSKEYSSITQRRDFHQWYSAEIAKKGHEVVWSQMAYFISKKLHLTNTFPFRVFLSKEIKTYSVLGSESVFNNCFVDLKQLFFSDKIFKGNEALQWDKDILQKEQYEWISGIYSGINEKTLKKLLRIAKGKGFYAILVPKKIRFVGDLKITQDRYDYAMRKLRPYIVDKYY